MKTGKNLKTISLNKVESIVINGIQRGLLNLDLINLDNDNIRISGWCSIDAIITIHHAENEFIAIRNSRIDVIKAYNLDSNMNCGFIFNIPINLITSDKFYIQIKNKEGDIRYLINIPQQILASYTLNDRLKIFIQKAYRLDNFLLISMKMVFNTNNKYENCLFRIWSHKRLFSANPDYIYESCLGESNTSKFNIIIKCDTDINLKDIELEVFQFDEEIIRIKLPIIKDIKNTKELSLVDFSFEYLRDYFLKQKNYDPYSSSLKPANIFAFMEKEGECQEVRANIEVIAISPADNRKALLVGWLLTNQKQGKMVIQTPNGDWVEFGKCIRIERSDVMQAFSGKFIFNFEPPGIITVLTAKEPLTYPLKLKWISDSGIYELSQINQEFVIELPNQPQSLAEFLFNIRIGHPSTWVERFINIEQKLIECCMDYTRNQFDNKKVQVVNYGNEIYEPLVSIIIPLYGQIDFVEHQLLEFETDPWIKNNAEIIYVLDDPNIVERFYLLAYELEQLYHVPFKVVWGGVNRGFSGANNLGVRYARADYFLFLNSDVFPQKTGWIEILIEKLKQYPDIGVIGPRLVFANGGIQHVGMKFIWNNEFNVWLNHHPCLGLDPKYDPWSTDSVVPAVTGACILIEKILFEEIGGWDEGYLIGDFEDSDLCLKIRATGRKILYTPDVQLIHLERQSMKYVGLGDFRSKVTIYNAAKHQKKWQHLIIGNEK